MSHAEVTNLLITVVGGLIGLLILIIGYVSQKGMEKLAEISDGIGRLNIETTSLKTWTVQHEKQDDERHTQMMDRMTYFEERR